jgi:hypothetical protein
MAKKRGPVYRKLFAMFWRDPDVRKLPAAEKLIAAYILTSPQTNGCGIFPFSLGMAAEDVGMLTQTFGVTFAEGFANVVDRLGWRWDEDARVLYIPGWWKWNHPDNPNTLKKAMGRLDEVPETPLLQEFASNEKHLKPGAIQTFRERIAERIGKGSGNQEQEQEQEQEQSDHIDSAFEASCAKLSVALKDWAVAEDWARRKFWDTREDRNAPFRGATTDEKEFLLRVAMMHELGGLTEGQAQSGINGIKLRKGKPLRTRIGYYRDDLRKTCPDFEAKFLLILRMGAPPAEMTTPENARPPPV